MSAPFGPPSVPAQPLLDLWCQTLPPTPSSWTGLWSSSSVAHSYEYASPTTQQQCNHVVHLFVLIWYNVLINQLTGSLYTPRAHTITILPYSLLCLQNFVEFSDPWSHRLSCSRPDKSPLLPRWVPPDSRRTVSEEGRAGTPSQGVGGWGNVGGTHWPRTRTVCVGGRGLITEHSTHGTQLIMLYWSH